MAPAIPAYERGCGVAPVRAGASSTWCMLGIHIPQLNASGSREVVCAMRWSSDGTPFPHHSDIGLSDERSLWPGGDGLSGRILTTLLANTRCTCTQCGADRQRNRIMRSPACTYSSPMDSASCHSVGPRRLRTVYFARPHLAAQPPWPPNAARNVRVRSVRSQPQIVPRRILGRSQPT